MVSRATRAWHHRQVAAPDVPEVLPAPHRVTTDRLVMRSYERHDALDVHEAIEENTVRLQAFMAWGHEPPQTVDERRERLDHFRREFDEGRGTNYGVFARLNGAFLGGVGVPVVGPGTVEVGYWLTAEAEGKRYASEMVSAMTLVCLRFRRATRVEIRCDPRNSRSRAVAQRVGYTWKGTTEWAPADGHPQQDQMETWVTTHDHLRLGPLATAPLPHLADARGFTLPWPD